MRATCVVHDTKTDKNKVILFSSPVITFNDSTFEEIQRCLKDGELLLELYDCGVECRTIGKVPVIRHEWIIDVVAKYSGYPSKEWVTDDKEPRSRKSHKVKNRFICFYFMRKYGGLSLPKIGEIFCGRDHSSVIHGIRTINNWLETDPVFAIELSEIEDIVTQKMK